MRNAWMLALGVVACSPPPPNGPMGVLLDLGAPRDLAGADLAGVDLAGVDFASPFDLGCTSGTTQCGAACVNLQSDPASCGRCGHGCAGGMCAGGVCQPTTLATPAQGTQMYGIAVDGAHVFFTNRFGNGGGGNANDTGVFQLNASGAAQTPTAVATWVTPSSPAAAPFDLAVNGTNVYWTNYQGSIWKGAVGGGSAPASVYAAPDFSLYVNRLATNPAGTHLFASLDDGTPMMKRVLDCAPSCTAVYSLASSAGRQVVSVAADGSYVYWAESGAPGRVHRLAIGATAGTMPVDLGNGVATPTHVAVSGAYVYWSNDVGNIYRSPIAGASPQLVVDSGYVQDLAADGTNVYWADAGNTRLRYAPAAGGAAADLVPAAGDPLRIALDATALYWIDKTAGSIRKIALP